MSTVGQLRGALEGLRIWAKGLQAEVPISRVQQNFMLSRFSAVGGDVARLGPADEAVPVASAPLPHEVQAAIAEVAAVFAGAQAGATLTDDDWQLVKTHLDAALGKKCPSGEEVREWVRASAGVRGGVPVDPADPGRGRAALVLPPPGTPPEAVTLAVQAGDVPRAAAALTAALAVAEGEDERLAMWSATCGALTGVVPLSGNAGPPGFAFAPSTLVAAALRPTRDVQAALRLADDLVPELENALRPWAGELVGEQAAALVDALEAAPRRLLDIVDWPRHQLRVVRMAAAKLVAKGRLEAIMDHPLAEAHSILLRAGAPPTLAAAFATAAEAFALWRALQWSEAREQARSYRAKQLEAIALATGESVATLVHRVLGPWRVVRGGQPMLASDLYRFLGEAARVMVGSHLRTALAIVSANTPKDKRDTSYDAATATEPTACPWALKRWYSAEPFASLEGLARRAKLEVFVTIADEALRRARAQQVPSDVAAVTGEATMHSDALPVAPMTLSTRGRSTSPKAEQTSQPPRRRKPKKKKEADEKKLPPRSPSPTPIECFACHGDHPIWRCDVVTDDTTRQAIYDARRRPKAT